MSIAKKNNIALKLKKIFNFRFLLNEMFSTSNKTFIKVIWTALSHSHYSFEK